MRKLSLLLGLALSLAAQSGGSKMVVLIVGPPGSGKTTQAKNLSRKYGIPAISMAGILKKEGGGKGGLNKRLKVQVASGELVNDQAANDLIARRIGRKDALRGFILDGYPATVKQADYLDAALKERGLPPPVVVHLEVPDTVALERMKGRRRADDQPEVMRARLEEYHREAQPVLEHYSGGQLKKVDGTRDERQVWQDIEQALGK